MLVFAVIALAYAARSRRVRISSNSIPGCERCNPSRLSKPTPIRSVSRGHREMRAAAGQSRVSDPLQALAKFILSSDLAAAFNPTGSGALQAAQIGFFGGFLLLIVAHLLKKTSEKLLQELTMINSMPVTKVDVAVKEAKARGFGKSIYTKLSGETWTSKPLESRRGIPVIAVAESMFEISEEFEWQGGDEDVLENGQRVRRKVDTGKRKEGKWVPIRKSRRLEDTTLCAASGICFHQLGAKCSGGNSPPHICIDLGKFKVAELLDGLKGTVQFKPSKATAVNIIQSEDQKPPMRVLGHETVERVAPLHQEVFALGDVSWQYAASVDGINSEGCVATLRPCPGKRFVFAWGSEATFQEQMQLSSYRQKMFSKVLDGVGIAGMCFAGVVAVCAAGSALTR